MPTYQYACTECGHHLEAVQSFSDAPLTQCPQCDGRLRKLFNSVGIVFKGSGFYRTDSRTGSSASGNGDSGDKPKTETSATKPAESTSSSSTGNGSSGSSATPASATKSSSGGGSGAAA